MTVADLSDTRIRLSDPKPAYCSACLRAAEEGVRFVDFDAAYDSGAFVDGLGAYVAGSDDLHLCEACVKGASRALQLKPDLHARQLREIRRLEIENEHLRDRYKRLTQAVAKEAV